MGRENMTKQTVAWKESEQREHRLSKSDFLCARLTVEGKEKKIDKNLGG